MKKSLCILFLSMISHVAFAKIIALPEKEVESILSMQTNELLSFSSEKKIELYKFVDPVPGESKDQAIDLLSKIPLVNKGAFSRYSGLFNGSILGVYFSKQTANLGLESDLIILSDQADRWTVAHEFAHALIDKSRSLETKKNEADDVELLNNVKEDFEELMRIYRQHNQFLGKSYVVRTLASFKVWSEILMSMLYMYELEEVRIEKFMQNLYENRPHHKLDSHTYKRSFWYIAKNCENARNKLNHTFDVLSYLETIIPAEYRNEMRYEVGAILNNLQKHENRINSLCNKD